MIKAMKLTIGCLLLSFGCTSVLAEIMYDWASSGSYTVGKAASVKIPEDGMVYLKLSGMKAGNNYTFVASGRGASVDVVYTYKDEGDEWDDTLATGNDDLKTSEQNRCIVDYDCWTMSYIVIEDPEDKEYKVSPKGYYLCVMGEEGETIALTSQTGAVEEPIPVGDIDNPKVLAPSSNPAVYEAKFLEDGTYCFTVNAKPGRYLLVAQKGTEDEPISINFEAGTAEYTKDDVAEAVASPGNGGYLVTVTKAGELNFTVVGTGTTLGIVHQFASAGTLGRVTVTIKGTAAATWSIKGATGKYESGESVAILGQQIVVFDKVTGFSTPDNQLAIPTEADPDVELVGVYNDSFDPKDDTVAGATKISPAAKLSAVPRTLFAKDELDHFVFTAKDGVYYNFDLTDLEGNAEMTVFAKGDKDEVPLAGPSVSIAKFAPGKGDYVVRIAHANDGDAQYTLEYFSANVGEISFGNIAYSAKKSAGSVTLTVNRSSSEGRVRVRYGTVYGSARPGKDYVAQSGMLEWADGDKKAKTIKIKLIPELFNATAISRRFEVRLQPLDEEELDEDEYLAPVTTGKDIAIVTLTEAKGSAEKVIKPATTKTEEVPLETGTYQGVIAEDGSALTNGFPALASVTFTAKNATKKALSAKVIIGGKTYAFAADTWDEDETSDQTAVAELTSTAKVGKETYENTLRIEVVRGATAKSGDWKDALAKVVLTMNVPDANNKGVQEEIVYVGELFRDNAKIQDYLTDVLDVAGYYTVALVPSGVTNVDGIPAGNGYLTLTIDNKGKAKIAGMLADGTTKPSYSSFVAMRDENEDGVIDVALVPVFVAKSPYCFGGALRLIRGEDGKFVVDSSKSLLWNNDNALLTYDGEEGWRIALDPVGGYFNTVNNLQAYYLTHEFSVSTADVEEIPEEVLATGYSFVTSVQPNEYPVSLLGNTLATDKKALVKDGTLYDLENSVNPCNVQVKLTRATGLVTGSFSVWSDNADGKQKEISGFKHNGILLLSRDEAAPLDPDVMTAGFFNQTATLSYTDEKGKAKTRKYTASMPFNILAVDQGEPDWYADDWGERPEE